MLTDKLTVLVEEAFAARRPLTLTFEEVRELADCTGIGDPREIHEPAQIVEHPENFLP